MWNSGIIQGLMWRTYNESGTLAYSFLESLVAMHPYYIARAVGGLLFLIGAVVGCYNIWMTIRDGPLEAASDDGRQPIRRPRQPGSRPCSDFITQARTQAAIGFVLAIIGVSSIGGLVEIAPLFTIDKPSRKRRTCGSIRRWNSPAATSTSARAAMPAIRR
jgi:hypothetical protein